MKYNIIDKILNIISLNIINTVGRHTRKKLFKRSNNAVKYCEKKLLKYIKKNRNTAIGKKYEFKEIDSIKSFQEKIPYTYYEDYKEYIECTINTGKQYLISSKKIEYFAHSSGTTGVTKMIPVSKRTFKNFYKYGAIFSSLYFSQSKIASGRGLNLIECEQKNLPNGLKTGYISAYAMGKVKFLSPLMWCIPKEALECPSENIDIKYIKARYALQEKNLFFIQGIFMSAITDLLKYIEDNNELLINDIEAGKINEKIKIPQELRKKFEKKLKPDINGAKELTEVFKNNDSNGLVAKIWPSMKYINAISTGEFSPFEEKIRRYCGNNIKICYFMYAASEGILGSIMNVEDKNYYMLLDSGFFEFIDINDKTERPLLMNELKKDCLYEVVITNYEGLYRYRINDVIRVMDFQGQIPIVQFAYRKQQVINMAGIHLTTEHITDIIKKFQEDIETPIIDYSIYVNVDIVPARLELFIETEGDIPEKYQKELSNIFDKNIVEVNEEYRTMLKVEECKKSVVYIVKEGTYEEYRKNKITEVKSENQIKTVRIIKKQEYLEFLKNNIKMS